MDFSTYLSPFTWRYGSLEMRRVFSEEHKYELWRKVWVALAEAQHKKGLVTAAELKDLKKHEKNIDIARILEIEKDTRHDVMAAIKEFAEKSKIGGGKIHLGATSVDITDNADTLRTKEALNIVDDKLQKLLTAFEKKIIQYAGFACMGYTHLQPAEPTTLGYRFAFYAQDLLLDVEFLHQIGKLLKTKGLKGAVGTSASYVNLLGKKDVEELETKVMSKLGLEPVLVANQTTPRKTDHFTSSFLTSVAQSLHKFAFDLRLMQSPGFGEWQEPFGAKQVGSSAMPFKKNPVKSEQICSLARLVFHLSGVAIDNAAHMLLERTLDDSANRRVYIPEMFLSIDEMLDSAIKIVDGLIIHEERIKTNLRTYGVFSATEVVLMQAVKKGADRQAMHDVLKNISMIAWQDIQAGRPNRMDILLSENKDINRYVSPGEISKMLESTKHIGNAKEKALQLARKIHRLYEK